MFQCIQLGNNLKEVVDKYKKYDESNAGLLKWLNSSEEEARKQQSEAIAADPQTLQKQLEETKARNTASQGCIGLAECVVKPNHRILWRKIQIYLRLWSFLIL